jgi:flavin-dependent dehydrogenase
VIATKQAAQLAAITAARAVERGDCSRQVLAEYEQAWHRAGGRELVYGHWLRRGFRSLPDWGLDRIVEFFGKPWAQNWIARLGDMDYPSRLFALLAATRRKRAMPKAIRTRRRVSMGV